jgi:hypothetical protein
VFFLYQLSAFDDETAGFATFVAIMENKIPSPVAEVASQKI